MIISTVSRQTKNASCVTVEAGPNSQVRFDIHMFAGCGCQNKKNDHGRRDSNPDAQKLQPVPTLAIRRRWEVVEGESGIPSDSGDEQNRKDREDDHPGELEYDSGHEDVGASVLFAVSGQTLNYRPQSEESSHYRFFVVCQGGSRETPARRLDCDRDDVHDHEYDRIPSRWKNRVLSSYSNHLGRVVGDVSRFALGNDFSGTYHATQQSVADGRKEHRAQNQQDLLEQKGVQRIDVDGRSQSPAPPDYFANTADDEEEEPPDPRLDG